jgi:hypothetical protein
VRTDSHLSVVKAQVRQGQLTEHTAERFESGRIFAVAGGLGLPRTWAYATGALLGGFEGALEAGRAEPKPGLARLLDAAEHARTALAEACERLVERQLPDASFAAVGLDRGELHVVSAGSVRVYLQRAGKPQRLTPRDDAPLGILRARVAHASLPVEPGDLVLVGSATAFSVQAISKVVAVLAEDGRTTPAVIASLLTDPAGQAGAAAAAAVVRVV